MVVGTFVKIKTSNAMSIACDRKFEFRDDVVELVVTVIVNAFGNLSNFIIRHLCLRKVYHKLIITKVDGIFGFFLAFVILVGIATVSFACDLTL